MGFNRRKMEDGRRDQAEWYERLDLIATATHVNALAAPR
jgi:hypothetical protein